MAQLSVLVTPMWDDRTRNEVFDPSWYLEEYPDVQAFARGPFNHFTRFGYREGRHPSRLSKVVGQRHSLGFSRDFMQVLREHEIDVLSETARPSEKSPMRIQGLSLPSFEEFREPSVSVVIPFFGKAHLTLACLRLLELSRPAIPFEVILVDDASLDSETEELRRIRGVRLIRRDVNGGFLAAANEGASAARGNTIVFLNNDAFPLPGWLERLNETLEASSRVGVVGSLLVGGDGRVSESGGIIFPDGNSANYGRGYDLDSPSVLFRRPVDYVSGASLAIRSELWRELNGFGVEFSPGYFEDADLCFRAVEKGYSVVVQPASQAVHIEGGTAGRDLTRGMKSAQVRNRQVFLQNWHDVLVAAKPRSIDFLERSSRAAAGGNILVMDALTPAPGRDAGSTFTVRLLELLVNLGWIPTLWGHYDRPSATSSDVEKWRRLGVDVVTAESHRGLGDLLAAKRGLFDVVFAIRHDVLLANLGYIQLLTEARLIYYVSDLHHLRESRMLAKGDRGLSMRTVEWTKSSESFASQCADATLTSSSVEVELLSEMTSPSKVHLLPWISSVERRPTSPPAGRNILFVGGFGHPPNSEAVDWFVANVWPIVRREVPGSRFLIVGSAMMPEDAIRWSRSGAQVLGRIEDLAPIYAVARASVAPLLTGAGFKGKVAESLSHGVPCVGTQLAFEGMGLDLGKCVLVADEASRFAAELIRLLTDDAMWLRMSACATEHVETQWHSSKAQSVLQALLTPIVETT